MEFVLFGGGVFKGEFAVERKRKGLCFFFDLVNGQWFLNVLDCDRTRLDRSSKNTPTIP